MNIIKDKLTIAELKHLAAKDGGVLLPERVVESARSAASPLHSYFTWDDDEAAANWRLHEARRLINVCVEDISVNDIQHETRVFVSLKSDRDRGGYRTMVAVLKDQSLREELVSNAMEEMDYFITKFDTISELAEVFKAMREAKVLLSK